MFVFFAGVIVGISIVFLVLYIIVVDPWGPTSPPPAFIDQFKPIQVPEELRQFLKSGEDGQGISKWESCFSLTLFLHMFYQEHKDSRQLRRWMHKRLQMELNDIATRSNAGRLLQEIRIRELSLGTKFPSLNAIRVENVDMSEDNNIFERIVFLVDVDYTGGFETSIDVTTMFGKKANLSIKITKLAGLVRIILSRVPYNHWTMSFVSAPVFETDISSQIQGHQLKPLIPLIKESIRRALQRKHVWPNYKIRYRPVFPNPLLQPSPPLGAFAHIKLEGGLEVTVLQCTRLKTDLVDRDQNWDVYCTLTMDQRPFLQNTSRNVAHALSVMLVFSRHSLGDPVGVTFEKQTSTSSLGPRPVRIATVEEGSLADKAMFKPGDSLIAINNVPIRSERQATRFLQQTTGDLMVLVDRNLDDLGDEELIESEELIGEVGGDPDDAFVAIGGVKKRPSTDSGSHVGREGERKNSTARRHSVSLGPSLPSVTSLLDTTTDSHSIDSSIYSLEGRFDAAPSTVGGLSVQRTESARVPHVLVSQPSTELRRTRSESQLDVKTLDLNTSSTATDFDVEETAMLESIHGLGEAPSSLGRPDVLDKKDRTLTANCSMLPIGGSSSSLQSAYSMQTDGTEDRDESDDFGGKLTRERPMSTRRLKLHATLAAGKRRVLDFMPQKKRLDGGSSAEPVEMGAEAGEGNIGTDSDRQSNSRSPVFGASGKRSPIETPVTDKKAKKKHRLKTPRCGSSKSERVFDSPSTSSSGSSSPTHSRTTKSVQLRENVLWGQSLHFELDGGSPSPSVKSSPLRSPQCKYLNVTIHAKQATAPSTPGSLEPAAEPQRPRLLGYVSLYIPQLLDDCRLTLSNCHREVFSLKPPTGVQTMADTQSGTPSSEFARHAGFDPRLCYGDVTLGFRYFPAGLPLEAAVNPAEESDVDVNLREPSTKDTQSISSSITGGDHEWTNWVNRSSGGTTCAMCRGKIWLKTGSCCQRCLVVCHNKCTAKANTGIACTPHRISESDKTFEHIDASDLNTAMIDAEEECSMIPSTPMTTAPPGYADSASRRTRIKNKVAEKFTSWRRGKKKDEVADAASDTVSRTSTSTADGGSSSPMASIQDCLSDVLPLLDGSPFIHSLYFQPGNAYNERTIHNSKILGKQIFANLGVEERKIKVNEQIDIIQNVIAETKSGRLAAMNEGSTSGFEGLDERLQALAVLMLHYCAALQDCNSTGRASPTDSLQDNSPSIEKRSLLGSNSRSSLQSSGTSSQSSRPSSRANLVLDATEDVSDETTVIENVLAETTVPVNKAEKK